MTPFDIVNVLTAAAPIVATVATACKSEKSVEVRKEPSHVTTNNITITYNNYFYTNTQKEAVDIARQMQNHMSNSIPSENRYML